MAPILDLNNDLNWSTIYEEQIDNTSGNYYTVIPLFAVPLTFDHRILRIRVNCQNQKPTWIYAGIAYQVTVSDTNKMILASESMYLQTWTALIWPQYVPEYALNLKFQWYLVNVFIQVQEYTGVDSDTLDQLIQSIKADTQAIKMLVSN